VILIFTIGHGAWLADLLLLTFLLPCARVLALLIGFSNREAESRADEVGANMTGDPEAMIRGLTLVYGLAQESRDRIFGPAPWKWVFFPSSLRATTHPSLEHRIARLRETPSAKSTV
jgi:Zn-dependent protease with chaperone function